MRPFPDCATARFVVCCSERAAAVVLSREQNAILRRECCKRRLSRRQARTCWEILIAQPQVEPVVLRDGFSLIVPTFHGNHCEQNQNRGSSDTKA
jgi:hypothetical protein